MSHWRFIDLHLSISSIYQSVFPFALSTANVKDHQETGKERTFMLVIREEISWYEEKERGELAAESIFCCDFSATSQSSSNGGRMQVGGGMINVAMCPVVEELKCYLALHVSFAHITP
jgi:hypothetical protein